MSAKAVLEKAIKEGKMKCPECDKSVQKYENPVDVLDSVWDGAGDSTTESAGCKATLICGNSGCNWKERTEYWEEYVDE